MSNKQSADERRVRKTRVALHGALESMLSTTSFSSITVHMLCDAADVNRSTFYLHYGSLQDLLLDAAVSDLSRLASGFETLELDNLDISRGPGHLVEVFRHVAARAPLYRTVLCEGCISPFHPAILCSIESVLVRRIEKIRSIHNAADGFADPALIASAMIGSVVGALAWWLRSGMPYGPDYMAERCTWIAVSGGYTMLGIPPPMLE